MPKFKVGESITQMVLFPETINDYLPEGHLAKLVLSIVSSLNIDAIIFKFSEL
ncbi:MAG: hypothetical protein KKC46_00535 [Proteobacteria bacterium]|nr:hypothetical protein [Pseudomonadota bacterium]